MIAREKACRWSWCLTSSIFLPGLESPSVFESYVARLAVPFSSSPSSSFSYRLISQIAHFPLILPSAIIRWRGRSPRTRAVAPSIRRSTAPLRPTESTLLLEIVPALHGDLAGIEFTLAGVAALVVATDLAVGLSGVAPGEVVEVPEGVRGQDEVPDRQTKQIDQHPEHVAEAVGGDDDEDAGKTEDESQEDEWDDWSCCVCDGSLDGEGDCREESVWSKVF